MIDKETIKADNRLVAKFMGYSFSQEYESFNDFDFTWEKENDGIWHKNVNEDQDVGYVKINGIVPKDYEYFLKYHKSWDWLMSVVDKIELITKFPVLIGGGVRIQSYNDYYYTNISYNSDGYTVSRYLDNDFDYIPLYTKHIQISKIEAVWLAVVEFIKWYNDNI